MQTQTQTQMLIQTQAHAFARLTQALAAHLTERALAIVRDGETRDLAEVGLCVKELVVVCALKVALALIQ